MHEPRNEYVLWGRGMDSFSIFLMQIRDENSLVWVQKIVYLRRKDEENSTATNDTYS